MKIITAYKCKYCGRKIYELKASCISHQYKCHWNQKNRSCASCSFLKMWQHKVRKYYRNYQTCILNNDLSTGLKTECPDYIEKYKCTMDKWKILRAKYKPRVRRSRFC